MPEHHYACTHNGCDFKTDDVDAAIAHQSESLKTRDLHTTACTVHQPSVFKEVA